MMNVLITGAGGFIGSHLVDRCIKDGHHVIGVDVKEPAHWIRGEHSSDRLHYIDISRRFPSDDFDICYHLAAESRIQPSFRYPLTTIETNLLGTAWALYYCKLRGARMVYAGSSTADDDIHKNVYATTKYQGEMLCKTWAQCFGVEVGVARFYNVYGPRHIDTGTYATVVGIFEKQYREGKALTVTGDGSQRRDFTHVDDIVEGLIAIGERGCSSSARPYSLGTGTNHSILEVAQMFVGDHRIEFIPRPPGESEVTRANDEETAARLGWVATRKLEDYVRDWKRAHALRSEVVA